MVRLTSIALAASISATALAGRAGNENYAQTRILREAAKLQKRDGVQSLQATGLTFSIGEGDDAKLYISPSGPSHKSHTLTGAGAVGTVPITVINVDGDVTCDTLGNLVVDFQQNDDVWDEVSLRSHLHSVRSAHGFHERNPLPEQQGLYLGLVGLVLLDRPLANIVSLLYQQYHAEFVRSISRKRAGIPSMYDMVVSWHPKS